MEIIKTGISRPPTLLVYAEHKVGKSTFGAGFPAPIFIQTESGLEGIETSAFPLVNTLDEFYQALDAVEKTTQFKTLVIDSVDWLERLIFRQVCIDHKVLDIASIGYGKGYVAAETIWGEIIDRLTLINRNKKLIILLLAHAAIQRFEDPERDSYDRMLPDLHKRSVNLLCEFVDILGYAAIKIVTTSKNNGPIKIKTSGERVLHLSPKGGFSAGNRYGLPDTLPLEWSALSAELKKKKRKGNLVEMKREKVDAEGAILLPTAEASNVGVN